MPAYTSGESNEELPWQFNITYEEPKFKNHIKFKIYKEPDKLSWNGYYKGKRICLWYTGEFWVTAGYVMGGQACYFRTIEKDYTLEMINKLIQCACFYLNTITTKPEE